MNRDYKNRIEMALKNGQLESLKRFNDDDGWPKPSTVNAHTYMIKEISNIILELEKRINKLETK